MKMLLTTFIFVLCITASVLLIKQYRSSAQSKSISEEAIISRPPTPSIKPTSPASASMPSVNTLSEVKKSSSPTNSVAGLDVKKLINVSSTQGLQPKALKSALNAYIWALHNGKLGSNKSILTVVDFTLPSYEKRMWVLDLRKKVVLMKLHTTQGAGSGLVYANRFSNTSMTQASSLGLYVTSDQYYGKHGKSMRLDGLQKGINNNARSRSIVIHEAPYASPEYIRANHRAGRSWGCFAVAPASKKVLLNYVKGGSALFAYARAIEKTSVVSNGPIAV